MKRRVVYFKYFLVSSIFTFLFLFGNISYAQEPSKVIVRYEVSGGGFTEKTGQVNGGDIEFTDDFGSVIDVFVLKDDPSGLRFVINFDPLKRQNLPVIATGTTFTLQFFDVNNNPVSVSHAVLDRAVSIAQNLDEVSVFQPSNDFSTVKVSFNGDVSITDGNGATNDVGIVVNLNSTLPVTFDSIEASLLNNSLKVSWKTIAETNNDHFEVEASVDGKTFTNLGSVVSKAPGGNSDIELSYSFSTTVSIYMIAASLLGLFMLAPTLRRRNKHVVALVGIIIVLFVIGCAKHSSELTSGWEKMQVRIAQVDKDGAKKYSKIVKVTPK